MKNFLQQTGGKSFAKLVSIIVIVALVITSMAIGILYQTAFEQIESQIITLARSEVALLRTIDAIEKSHPHESEEMRQNEVLEMVVAAHVQSPWPLPSQELAIGRKTSDGEIAFVLRLRNDQALTPQLVKIGGAIGGPMQQALSGQSGTTIGLDYRGEKVLAAYEFVSELELGVVAKIDLAEVQRPFLVAAASVFVIAFFVTIAGGLFAIRFVQPIIWQLVKKKREHLLAETELRKLSAAMQQSSASVVITDCEGKIEYVNLQFVEVTGYTPEEVLGRNPSMFASGETPPETYINLWKSIKSGKTWKGVLLNKKKDGTFFWEETSIAPIKNKAGEITNFVAVKEDITARRNAEQQTEQLNRELLEASHQATLSVMASDIFHNVGNLLVTVTVGLVQLRDGVNASQLAKLSQALAILPDSEELPRFFAEDPRAETLIAYLHQLSAHLVAEWVGWQINIVEIMNAGIAISQVIAAQQNFVRIRRGIEEGLDLVALFEELFTMLADSFERHRITIVRRGFDSHPRITAERQFLLQAFANLLWNARDALKEQHDHPRQLIVAFAVEQHAVTICVTDNGCGIAPENLEKLFIHGFTTKARGNGFGLHSAKLAIENSGGTIYVESAGIGFGTTFTITIDIKEEKQDV